MRRSLPILAAILLVGCQSQAEREEHKYEIVAAGTDAKAKCEQGRKVAAAYLDAGDQAKYESSKLRADIDCTTADLDVYTDSLRDDVDLDNAVDTTRFATPQT